MELSYDAPCACHASLSITVTRPHCTDRRTLFPSHRSGMASSLVILLLFLVVVHGDDGDVTCSSGCSCTGANYTIDLSSISFKPNFTDSIQTQFSYVISPCKPFQCSGISSVVCQYGANKDGKQHPYSCGGPDGAAVLSMHSFSPLNFSIKYTGGEDKRSSIITFTQGSPHPDTGKSLAGDLYQFTVTGDISKVMQTKGSGGGVAPGVIGIVIIILALATLVTYFIAGMVFMYFVRGARGVEMVPNVVFWKDFPILLKDGFAFTFGPCVRALSKEQAYDKI